MDRALPWLGLIEFRIQSSREHDWGEEASECGRKCAFLPASANTRAASQSP